MSSAHAQRARRREEVDQAYRLQVKAGMVVCLSIDGLQDYCSQLV